jgi:hypothetical protein
VSLKLISSLSRVFIGIKLAEGYGGNKKTAPMNEEGASRTPYESV